MPRGEYRQPGPTAERVDLLANPNQDLSHIGLFIIQVYGAPHQLSELAGDAQSALKAGGNESPVGFSVQSLKALVENAQTDSLLRQLSSAEQVVLLSEVSLGTDEDVKAFVLRLQEAFLGNGKQLSLVSARDFILASHRSGGLDTLPPFDEAVGQSTDRIGYPLGAQEAHNRNQSETAVHQTPEALQQALDDGVEVLTICARGAARSPAVRTFASNAGFQARHLSGGLVGLNESQSKSEAIRLIAQFPIVSIAIDEADMILPYKSILNEIGAAREALNQDVSTFILGHGASMRYFSLNKKN